MSFGIISLKTFIESINFGILTPEILGLIAVIIMAATITRDKNEIVLAAFPMAYLAITLGFNIPSIILAALAIIFIIMYFTREPTNTQVTN